MKPGCRDPKTHMIPLGVRPFETMSCNLEVWLNRLLSLGNSSAASSKCRNFSLFNTRRLKVTDVSTNESVTCGDWMGPYGGINFMI